MDVQLRVSGGKAEAEDVKLTKPTVIGRAKGCGLRIVSGLVSRQHCELLERDGRPVIRDLGSANGTFVNGERVSERVLRPGDELVIGPLAFTVSIPGFRDEDGGDTCLEVAGPAEPAARESPPGPGSSESASDWSEATVAETEFELPDVGSDEAPSPEGQAHLVLSEDDVVLELNEPPRPPPLPETSEPGRPAHPSTEAADDADLADFLSNLEKQDRS